MAKVRFFLLLFCSFTICSSTFSCPVNFTYLENYKTELSACQQDPFSLRCCWFLRPVVMIGFAQYLKESSMFFLPNSSYIPSCLSTLKQKLNDSSVDQAAVSLCLKNPSFFTVDSNTNCHGIATLQDWNRKAGPTPSFDASCKGDLGSEGPCASCTTEGAEVAARLTSDPSQDGDFRSCVDLTVMYAAGIASEHGPLDNRTSFCLMSALRDGPEPDRSPTNGNSSKGRVLQLVFGVVGGVILLVTGVLVLLYRKKFHCRQNMVFNPEPGSSSLDQSDLQLAKMGLQWFRLQELERATDGFSSKNLVGKGTFGAVYRGKLEGQGSSSLVAVKELHEVESFGNDEEFVNEVEIVSKIKHRNLLSLRGCCVEKKRRFLVYDFMANGSVADHLSNMPRRIRLCWEQRKNIIVDVAKGLVYLHCGVKPEIYHRDIKASNILLDLDLRAKVADFGLARQGKEDGHSHITTRVAGTCGFLAPEYAMYGHLSHKSDVYSFGVLILEIMTARKVIDTSSSDSSTVLITDWVWDLVKAGRVGEVFDECMKDDDYLQYSDGEMMTRFVMVGILCAHVVASHRPTITEALKMLEGAAEVPKTPERPLLMSRESLASGTFKG